MNGWASSSKQTKHIRVQYFFIQDKINSGEIHVKYCPMEKMWSEVLMKPKQGQPFHEMCSHWLLWGWWRGGHQKYAHHTWTYQNKNMTRHQASCVFLQECFGENKKSTKWESWGTVHMRIYRTRSKQRAKKRVQAANIGNRVDNHNLLIIMIAKFD